MTYAMLPLTEDPWQVFTVDLTINGAPFHAQVEIRYLPAPDQWFLSIWDHASGEMLINQIPVICSYELVNDPASGHRSGTCGPGAGLGSLFCLRNTDAPSTPDPAKGNLSRLPTLWGDTFDVPGRINDKHPWIVPFPSSLTMSR